jgi:serine/threonine-protein kinase HipA
MSERELVVYINLDGVDTLVGRLWSRENQGRSTSTFAYDRTWIGHPRYFDLSPALPKSLHPFQVPKALPAVFTDCAPDSWGQKLMRRGERMLAEKCGKAARALMQVDFLAGVDDLSRMGALRFKAASGDPFLTTTAKSIPPLIDLPELLGAADRLDRGKERNRDVAIVLAPGTSLGGARPKATVRDKNGALLIAKFPKADDAWPVILWEAVTLELAKMTGITTPTWRLEVLARKPVLLLNRFDRMSAGSRIPFMSAMTALDASDHAQGHSYLEIAETIRRTGSKPTLDLEQLWRRIAFNIMVSNTDDHLRNHAFLHDGKGWRLSPAFDMNPMPPTIKPRIHALAIDDRDGTASLELVLSVAPHFGLSSAKAKAIAAEIGATVATWRDIAKKQKLKGGQLDQMAPAFEHADLKRALALPTPPKEVTKAKAKSKGKKSAAGRKAHKSPRGKRP